MLYFLIPLRSRAAAKDWNTVSSNFQRTLDSCYQQSNNAFRIIVVCHDIPKLNKKYDERVTFVNVCIATPTNTKEMMFDKGYKLYTGMYYIRSEIQKMGMSGVFVLPVDADDLVNCHLADFLALHCDEKCYMSSYGYIWQDGSRFYTIAKDLYRTCGSCCVIYYKVEELPDKPFEEQDKDKKYIFQNSHRYLPVEAQSRGKVFGVIPFPTTVYVVGTGENHSILSGVGISWLRKLEGLLRIPRHITNKKRKEYNLI